MDPSRRKIIFLGNTILEDGIVPRIYNKFRNDPNRHIFRQALFDDEGINVRPEVFHEKIIERLRSMGDTSFSQNYLLLPYAGQGIIKRHHIHYTTRKETYERIVIGIDPSISTKAVSDPFAIVIS